MYTIEKTADNRLDIVLSGKLDAGTMPMLLDELIAKAGGIEDGMMFFDIERYELPSWEAIRIELSRLPELLRFIRQFSRAAVLSDETWINTLSTLEGKLIPGLKIKAFPRHQRYQAESWLQSDT